MPSIPKQSFTDSYERRLATFKNYLFQYMCYQDHHSPRLESNDNPFIVVKTLTALTTITNDFFGNISGCTIYHKNAE